MKQTFPSYKCHKVVTAIKIAGIELMKDGSAIITPENGAFEKFQTVAGFGQLFKGSEQDFGYYVEYPDGYASWSPTVAFEEGYTALDAEEKEERSTPLHVNGDRTPGADRATGTATVGEQSEITTTESQEGSETTTTEETVETTGDDSEVEVYDGPMGKYRITGEVENLDEEGNVVGFLEVDSVQEVPTEIGDKWVGAGTAEKVEDGEVNTTEVA